MASSGKSRKNEAPDLPERVHAFLRAHAPPGSRLTLALSGGLDSVVLADLVRRARRGYTLSAVHVNHQLQPAAAGWARFCRALCRGWDIPLKVVKVDVASLAKATGGIEAAARAARYRAYAALRTDFVLLAHHLDDQAETLMLQLLRGSGIQGAAAMPEARTLGRDGGTILLRPLLDVPRAALEAYARRRRLAWVEDGSNADTAYARNFLRAEILPLIERRYPGYRAALARASRHFGESAELLEELAHADLGGSFQEEALPLSRLRALSPARARNALRHWLRARGAVLPNSARLDEGVRQARRERPGALTLQLEGGELRAHRDALWLLPPPVAAGAPMPPRRWKGEAALKLPALGGVLTLRRRRGGGISLARLRSAEVTVRPRMGGERMRPAAGRPRRSLKQLLQEAGIPPWQRERLPLLFCGEALVYVPGIGVDCDFRAAAGEPAVEPEWTPT